MRKKSHISLARYMVRNLNDESLRKHRFAFYLGSILPDIKPSFLYRRHEIDETFPDVRGQIARLSEGERTAGKTGRKFYMDLGQISHYLADYFTFPHNKSYPGGLREHCSYEEQLKHDLKSYVKDEENQRTQEPREFHSAEALCDYIQDAHDDYISGEHGVEDDIATK